jgi:formylglycine-generating enzyme required for sulfatase activity
MISIAAAEFPMGSDAAADAEDSHPAHQVTLHGYCIDRTEVTTERYRACVAKGHCSVPNPNVAWPKIRELERKAYKGLCNYPGKARGNQPINCVTWVQASAYCKAQNARLPTEAEWEYAARGPQARLYPWGDEEPTAKHLNACGKECVTWSTSKSLGLTTLYPQGDGFAVLAPVGRFALGRSSFGLDDMAGNAAEWVSDFYGPYTKESLSNPEGPAAGERHVVRGASFTGGYASHYRALMRGSEAPATVRADLGFRCAQALP